MKGRRPCPEGWPVARAFASPVSGAACACCSSPGRLAGPCSRCFGPSPGRASDDASVSPCPRACSTRRRSSKRRAASGWPPGSTRTLRQQARSCAKVRSPQKVRKAALPFTGLHCGLAADNVAHFQVGSALGRWPMDCRVPLILTPQAAGGCAATSPLLPELVPEGNSAGEALQNVKDALRFRRRD